MRSRPSSREMPTLPLQIPTERISYRLRRVGDHTFIPARAANINVALQVVPVHNSAPAKPNVLPLVTYLRPSERRL